MKERIEVSVVGSDHSSVSWNLDSAEQLPRVVKSCPKSSTRGLKMAYLESLNDNPYLVNTWEIHEK